MHSARWFIFRGVSPLRAIAFLLHGIHDYFRRTRLGGLEPTVRRDTVRTIIRSTRLTASRPASPSPRGRRLRSDLPRKKGAGDCLMAIYGVSNNVAKNVRFCQPVSAIVVDFLCMPDSSDIMERQQTSQSVCHSKI